MTTYPRPTDLATAFTRADGTTEAHSIDHGRVIGIWENVKHHGAKGDGVTDDSAAIQAAVDAAGTGGTVFLPKGSYKVNTPISLSWDFQTFTGVGGPRSGTTLLCKNIYALTVPSSGDSQGVAIQNLHITLDDTSTSGGAIQFKNNNYASSPYIGNVECFGSTSSPDPLVMLGTWITGMMERCRLAQGQIGLQMGGAGLGFPYCNNNTVQFVTFGQFTVAGTYFPSLDAESNTFIGCDWESNTGYGIKVDYAKNLKVYASWFEGNGKTDIYLRNTWAAKIRDCHFVGLGGTPAAGNYFVDIQSTGILTSADASRFVTIEDNLCMNYPNGGAGLYTHFNIGTNVGGTLIYNNMVQDNGSHGVIADAGVLSEYRRNYHRLFDGNVQAEKISMWQETDVGSPTGASTTYGTRSWRMKDFGGRTQFRTVNPDGNAQMGGVMVGHLYGNTVDFPASVTVGAAAGSGASASVVGNDLGGVITVNVGTGPSTGTLCTLNFTAPYDAVVTNVSCVLTFKTSGAPINGAIYADFNKDGGLIKVDVAPTASTTYKIAYQIVGMTGV